MGKMIITLALVLIAGAIMATNVVKLVDSSMTRKKKEPLSNREKMGFWLIILIFAGLHCLLSKTLLVVMLGAVLLVGCFIAADAKKKLKYTKLMALVGAPAVVAIIVNIVFDVIAKSWSSLRWLIAPAVFYLFLWFYGRIGREKAEKPDKELNFDFVPPLIATVVLAALAVVIFTYSKGVIK